jgi:AmmeMemoRadiSam system protein B/AmmeMemoRadiSam system protein A
MLLVLAAAGCDDDPPARPEGGTPAPASPAAPEGGSSPSPAARWDVKAAPAVPAGASVREAAWDDRFYPGDAPKLRADVEGRLARAGKPPELPGKLRALIVPHAGYVYSGNTAAAAYATLKGRGFDRVVLLGPAHRHRLPGVSVSGAQFYRTPLGAVAVDTGFAARMREKSGAAFVEAAHAQEHSLEVQLPFLQTAIGPGVRIVPVLVGPDAGAQKKLAAALAGLLDERTLVVVSTDLSHFPPQEIAEKIDARTVESWKTLDVAKVIDVEREIILAAHRGVSCASCGSYGVRTLMQLAPLAGIDEVRILRTETSAAAGGDRARVVGYAAAAFLAAGRPRTGKPKPAGQEDISAAPKISAAGRKKLLEIARAAATARAGGKRPPALDLAALPEELRRGGGAFVTLTNRGRLRGCIGRFPGDDPVALVVRDMAAASTQDSRFAREPVTAAEMAEITVKISVLSPLRRIDDWKRVEAGVHGVLLRRGWKRGVFLPQVATEQGWDREEFLTRLARDKAGMAADAYKDPDTQIFVFTALVFGEEK